MAEKLRKSGIDIIGDIPWGTHFCQFYQEKGDLMDMLVPYLKTGLENNEFCMWVTSQPREMEEAKEAMGRAVPDFDIYLEKGQIEIIPYTHWIKEGIFDPERVLNKWVKKLNQALASGYDGLRLAGNTFWLEKKDLSDFIDYEKKVDAVISNYPMIAICTYSLDMHNITETIDIVSSHQLTLVKKEGKWERIENSGRKDITESEWAGSALRQNEQHVRLKSESISSSAQEMANLELSEIIDIQAIQPLMDDFYKLTHIPIGLNDLKGNVLIGVGWQDICTKFHRARPETCKHCVESNIKLSAGVLPGEFKAYKCKNNMWDIVTPIMVGDQHVGYIFAGQFFFEDESVDYELFRSQARQYGFNEEEYIAALERVPRLSREVVNIGMAFFMTFANMLSQLSYSNIKLAHSLAEREALVEALSQSEKRERARSEELAVLLDVLPVAVYIAHDPQALQITGNHLSYEWQRIPVGTNLSKSAPEGERPEMFKLFKNGVEIPPSKMPLQMSAKGIEINDCELDIVSADGQIRHVLGNARPLRDEQGNLRGSISAFIDITERKRAEDALRVREERLRRMSHAGRIGLYEWNADRDLIHFSREAYELYGCDPESPITYEKWLARVHPDDRKMVERGIAKAHKNARNTPDISVRFEFRVVHVNGTVLWLEAMSTYYLEGGDLIARGAVRDITERKLAEEALKKAYDNVEEKVKERTAELEKAYNSLKESEKGLAEAQKMAHIGNWDWDLVTDKVYWSDELYRIFGRNPEESGATYDELLNYIHPEDRDYVDNAIQGALYEKPLGIDYRIVRANGEERTVHAQSEIFFNEKNIPVRAKGIVQDVTEHKKLEEKIRNLANIVESSNDAIITVSLDGIITSWNKGAQQVYGYSSEEILGKNASILAPDNLKDETKKLIDRVKHGIKIKNYETSRLKKDGTLITVSITLSPVFDSHGKLTDISAIYRDITEKKRAKEKLRESEEKYRNIVETANEGILVIDDESIITYANKKMTDMLGYTLEEGIGRPVWDFADEESKSILKQNLEKRRQGINESYELKLICKDGSPLWAHINAKSLFDKDGKFMGVMSMLTDITERKKAEEALERMDKVRIKEIHHRIKNNLQVISSLLDLQADKFEDENVKEAFREGQNRVISMSLIHEELYKGEGTDTLNFSTYIRELTENLFQTYSLSIKNLILCIDLEENSFFDMDTAVPLGIIVNELVSNSLKHAFPGRDKGRIHIKLHREENGERINNIEESKNAGCKSASFILTVSDNGIGIPENLDLENPDSLGIQLVTTLVDQLDGELELKRNNGTEFIIRFTVIEK